MKSFEKLYLARMDQNFVIDWSTIGELERDELLNLLRTANEELTRIVGKDIIIINKFALPILENSRKTKSPKFTYVKSCKNHNSRKFLIYSGKNPGRAK